MEDKRGVLTTQAPFSYRLIGEDKALIFYENKLVYTAVGKNYLKLRRAIESHDSYSIQLCMAKMTGNFKHGNERR